MITMMMMEMLAFAPFTIAVEMREAKKEGVSTCRRKPRMEMEPDALHEAGDNILPPGVAEKTNL